MDTKITGLPTNQLGRVESTRADALDALGRPKKKDDAQNIDSSVIPAHSTDYDVNLSTKARQIAEARAKATAIARNTPDVREDKVAALKQQIQSGSYKVDPGKIADGMMREALLEHLAETDEPTL